MSSEEHQGHGPSEFEDSFASEDFEDTRGLNGFKDTRGLNGFEDVLEGDDARYFHQLLGSYELPSCPHALTQRIFASVDAEAEGERMRRTSSRGGWLPGWTRLLVPAAALALVVLLLLPVGRQAGRVERSMAPVSNELQLSRTAAPDDPCRGELEEIFRRLGVDRSQVVYDDETICAAAKDVRIALSLMDQAMDSTERIIGQETRRRFSKTLRKGLGSGFGSPTKRGPGLHQGG